MSNWNTAGDLECLIDRIREALKDSSPVVATEAVLRKIAVEAIPDRCTVPDGVAEHLLHHEPAFTVYLLSGAAGVRFCPHEHTIAVPTLVLSGQETSSAVPGADGEPHRATRWVGGAGFRADVIHGGGRRTAGGGRRVVRGYENSTNAAATAPTRPALRRARDEVVIPGSYGWALIASPERSQGVPATYSNSSAPRGRTVARPHGSHTGRFRSTPTAPPAPSQVGHSRPGLSVASVVESGSPVLRCQRVVTAGSSCRGGPDFDCVMIDP